MVATPEIHGCCSRHLETVDAAMKGLGESPRNHPPEIDSQGRTIPAFAAFSIGSAVHLIGKTWEPGRVISVGFLDGSLVQKKKAQKWAETWLQFANLKFAFNQPGSNDVRVSFGAGGSGSWSMIGTDALSVRSGPTVNFGWVTDSSTDQSDEAVIVHEFGHALGLGHEQSNPNEDIKWNKPAALKWYMQTQGWTAQMVEDNVFAVFDPASVVATAYDRDSIMQYPVPAELTTDGRGIGWNTVLSPLDKTHIALMYPGVAVPPPVAPPSHPNPPNLGIPHVVIGQPPAHVAIPSPGKPARFRLDVPGDGVYLVSCAVDQSFGRSPGLVIVPDATGTPLTIGLVHGKGLFEFEAGAYEFQVFNPTPGLLGNAWVKVSAR